MFQKAVMTTLLLSLALASCADAGDVAPPSYKGGYYPAGVGSYRFAGGAAEAVPETILTIVSTRLTYPNLTLPAYDYDIENLADDGSSIRYSWVDGGNPDVVKVSDYYMYTRGTTYERGNGGNSLQWQGWIWLSLNGADEGDRVNFAELRLSRHMWQNSDLDPGAYFVARVDTVSSDYGCLNSVSTSSDPCHLDISFNDMDATQGTPWTPSLASRFDWWEYGPRSKPLAGDAFGVTQGDTVVLDITDAIQQVVDRGQEYIDRGVLITLGSVNQTSQNWGLACGNNASYLPLSGGNPALVFQVSNKRGGKVWGSGKVPVILTYDDEHHEDVGIFEALGSGSPAAFDWVCYADPWAAWCDSLYLAEQDNINFIMHGYHHTQLGSLTGAALNESLDKTTWLTGLATMPDTTNIQFAWPGGGGSPFYSMESLRKMQKYGYLAGRGTGTGSISQWSNDTPVGRSNFLSWDWYTNLYTVTANNISSVLLDGVPIEDEATIRHNLMEQVDWMYTDGGRGAATFYGHSDQNGITMSNHVTLAGIIDDSFFMERRSFGDVIGTMRDRGFVDVSDVVAETEALKTGSVADSLGVRYQYASAVRQDSTRATLTPEVGEPFNQMWVGPAGGRDVVLAAIGNDIIPGEFFTPPVDFAGGELFYFDPLLDPLVDARGSGTLKDPFYGFGYELEADTVVVRIRLAGGAVENAANGPVAGEGDVCILLGGDHGALRFESYSFGDYMGVAGAPGETATFDYIRAERSTYWYFENLTSNRNLRMGGGWDWLTESEGVPAYGDTSRIEYNSAPYIVTVSRDEHGNGISSNIVFNNITCIVAETSVSDGWTGPEWNWNMVSGINFRHTDYAHVQNSLFKSVNYGVKASGTDYTDLTSMINIIGNEAYNVAGGAWGVSTGENVTISDNISHNLFLVNYNHIDHLQFHGSSGDTNGVANALITRNEMFTVLDPNRDAYGFNIDGWIDPYDDWHGYIGSAIGLTGGGAVIERFGDITISNNIIHTQGQGVAWGQGAIHFAGRNIIVANNTVVCRQNPVDHGGYDPEVSGIWVDGPCLNTFIVNNISGGFVTDTGVTVLNNEAYGLDFSGAGFSSWYVDGDPRDYDLTLTAGSGNIDAGTATNAPPTDILGTVRPQGAADDIGAYERP